jgi:hypothetical protein
MSAIGPRTTPIYSMTVDVDDPTRAILSDHGIDAPYPTEFKLKFQVYKKVAVTAGLVTSAEEDAWVLSMHVALALLRDLRTEVELYDLQPDGPVVQRALELWDQVLRQL